MFCCSNPGSNPGRGVFKKKIFKLEGKTSKVAKIIFLQQKSVIITNLGGFYILRVRAGKNVKMRTAQTKRGGRRRECSIDQT